MMWLKILALLVTGGLAAWMLLAGTFYTLLTSGGDRGGDSGVREAGCICLLAGFALLAAFGLIWGLA